jgi:hypothetical protein
MNTMSQRDCGDCTICCWFFAVPETGKPTGQWCEHCTPEALGGGCGIHASRPPSCRNFQCFWLMEEGIPDDMRPDHCGVVVSFNEDHGSVVVHVDPQRPDALDCPPGEAWLPPLLAAFDPVCIVCGDERMVIRREEAAGG